MQLAGLSTIIARLVAQRPHLDEATQRELSHPRVDRWLRAAVIDWTVIITVFVVVARIDHPLAYGLAIVPLGSRQQGLGALFHDAAHRLVTRHRALNEILGNVLAAWPLGLTLGGYRRYHFAHHRHLGTEFDPEVAHKRGVPQWPLPASPLRTARDFASDLIGGGVPHLVAAGSLTRPVSFAETAGIGLFWLAILFIAWQLHVVWIPILWIASIATVFWSGVRLRIWTEHLGTKDTHRIAVPVWLQHLIMPHDIGLHWEHHHFPSVPFWNLHKLRALLPPGHDGAPPLVSLSSLLRAFVLSTPLRSGEIGVTIGPDAALTNPTDEQMIRERAVKELDVLRLLMHVALPFVAALFVYIACRRQLPVALSWLPVSGFFAGKLNARFVDWFPDFAWSYSLTALMTLLWANHPGRARWLWIASAFVASAAWEIGQRYHFVPGVFDHGDLVFGIVGCALAVFLCSQRFIPDLSTHNASPTLHQES